MTFSIARAVSPLHGQSTADDIRAKIGDIDGIDIFHNQILVAIFVRPNRTAGGIELPDQTLNEDLYQGKVGLVLKTGPLAFTDDSGTVFGGKSVTPGEWVVYRVSDGFQLKINGVTCRLLEDVHVKATIPNPLAVY